MKKFLALALALVMVLGLGATAFAEYIGVAGGTYQKEKEDEVVEWEWDVFETNAKKFCRVMADFRLEEFRLFVNPAEITEQLVDNGKWDPRAEWDFDEDEFEIYTSGPIEAEWEVDEFEAEVEPEDVKYEFVEYKGHTVYGFWDKDGEFVGYFYDMFDDETDTRIRWREVDGYIVYDEDVAGDNVETNMTPDATYVADKVVFDRDWAADEDFDPALAGYKYAVWEIEVVPTAEAYFITVYPQNDFGTKVVRASLKFKMIDYTSGRTQKFESAPLYIDLYHVDVFEKDVKNVAGERKALVLDEGLPYDNAFKVEKHINHENKNDYDWNYNLDKILPDMISAENFDEGVGKTLKITDLDKTWQLDMAKVAEYQPSINFDFDTEVDETIEAAFPDANFQALNFLSAETMLYKTAAKLTINPDTKALGLKGEDVIYAYKYVDGVLEYQDSFAYNMITKADKSPVIELAAGEYLGNYYLSDTDLRPVEAEDTNPNTGANDVVGVAVALAVVSLVAAAAVSLKK